MNQNFPKIQMPVGGGDVNASILCSFLFSENHRSTTSERGGLLGG